MVIESIISDRAKDIPTNKAVLLIIDGLGDLPVAALSGKTPLEAAKTPIMDYMAANGSYGQVDPILPGEIPNTHSGTGMLMGMLSEQADRLARGPVEAAGAGQVLKPGEIALRANFATVQDRQGLLYVSDRRAGRIANGTEQLAALLTDVDLGDGVRAKLRATDQHRGVLIISGPGLSASVSDTDPGDVALPALLKECKPLDRSANMTAAKINILIKEAHRKLAGHAVNKARRVAGELPANGIITRGAGSQFNLKNTLSSRGACAAVISGCNTVLGLGRIFGFTSNGDSRFTATFDTDLHAKITQTVTALESHDMVFIHVKAPDICSHDRQPSAKRDFLQRLDTALEPLLKSGAVIAVAADHTTDSNSGFHTADPVPALIYKPGSSQASSTGVKFGEAQCRRGNLGRLQSSEFLSQVLSSIGF